MYSEEIIDYRSIGVTMEDLVDMYVKYGYYYYEKERVRILTNFRTFEEILMYSYAIEYRLYIRFRPVFYDYVWCLALHPDFTYRFFELITPNVPAEYQCKIPMKYGRIGIEEQTMRGMMGLVLTKDEEEEIDEED